MKAASFQGMGDLRLDRVSEPKIQSPTDAILRLTFPTTGETHLQKIRGTFVGLKSGMF